MKSTFSFDTQDLSSLSSARKPGVSWGTDDADDGGVLADMKQQQHFEPHPPSLVSPAVRGASVFERRRATRVGDTAAAVAPMNAAAVAADPSASPHFDSRRHRHHHYFPDLTQSRASICLYSLQHI
jgi:hypothetical protein